MGSRTKELGFHTPNDIIEVFNKETRFDAGDGAVGFSFNGLEIIFNPKTKTIITLRPAKKWRL